MAASSEEPTTIPVSEPLTMTPEEQAAADLEAQNRATAILARTYADPIKVAQENAELRESIKGAYALMHVMLRRLGGDIYIKFEDHSNIPASDGDLQISRDPKTGDISLRLHKPNREQRRARR